MGFRKVRKSVVVICGLVAVIVLVHLGLMLYGARRRQLIDVLHERPPPMPPATSAGMREDSLKWDAWAKRRLKARTELDEMGQPPEPGEVPDDAEMMRARVTGK